MAIYLHFTGGVQVHLLKCVVVSVGTGFERDIALDIRFNFKGMAIIFYGCRPRLEMNIQCGQ